MYGPTQVPQVPRPPRSSLSGGRIALLVLFCLLALLSCGFLSWAPLLRLACVTRRVRDWVVCGVLFAGSAALFAYAAATGDKEAGTAESFAAVGVMVTLVAGSITYYLFGEIRHAEGPRTVHAYGPAGYDAYGSDGVAATVPRADVRPNPYTAPVAHPPVVPGPATPVPQPPGPRIDQVRAELDELSHLLRKETGEPREGDGVR
ncbi:MULTISPECIES: hypothetical protein [unclassified Streptomyces]|uniref:hypothetical protein n=1 Tax=unclassified Streptomyces TaxID=2593676 RepID=UPI0006AFAE2D|nr:MULTISPECIES: hypothetical protein [unclassified Streptomyces]KOX35740.1 hypothetical protein ADL06_06270 [Streptomyces sp. NRRL F-6491]KOX37725.1 hypothetical protein ADL08_29315 [Streptomyces sp. NRRL F-6492]